MTKNELIDKAATLPGWFRMQNGFIRCDAEGTGRFLCPLEAVAHLEKLDTLMDLDDIGERFGLTTEQTGDVIDAADGAVIVPDTASLRTRMMNKFGIESDADEEALRDWADAEGL